MLVNTNHASSNWAQVSKAFNMIVDILMQALGFHGNKSFWYCVVTMVLK